MGRTIFLFLLSMALAESTWAQRTLEVDLTNQEAYLMDRGRVILQSPICSGRPGHETPTGRFKVAGKDLNHASSVYGFFGNPATKQIVLPDADIYMKVPRGLEFVRAPMHYYTQFTPAMGFHAGILPGVPSSHGCIRLPEEYAVALFQQAPVGTPVHIFGHPQAGREYWASAPRTPPPVAEVPTVARFGWTAADRAFAARGRDNRGFRQDREAAFDRFEAEWEARIATVDRQIEDTKARRDYYQGYQREQMKARMRSLKDYKENLEIQRDAAKEVLKRQWGD
jgi:L,D-transpeptidase catalytic domain